MSSDRTIDALRDAINSHDPNEVARVFAEDYQCEVPMHPSRSFTGRASVQANWTMMFARIPDIRAQILRADFVPDRTWSEWELTGSSTDGDPVVFRGVVISTARDGEIDFTRFYLDEVISS